MKKCINCGATLSENQGGYCGKCGTEDGRGAESYDE
mgnify:CR=1 FL=1